MAQQLASLIICQSHHLLQVQLFNHSTIQTADVAQAVPRQVQDLQVPTPQLWQHLRKQATVRGWKHPLSWLAKAVFQEVDGTKLPSDGLH